MKIDSYLGNFVKEDYADKDLWVYILDYGDNAIKKKIEPTKVKLILKIDLYYKDKKNGFDLYPYGKKGIVLTNPLKNVEGWDHFFVEVFDNEKECIDEYIKECDDNIANFKQQLIWKQESYERLINEVEQLKKRYVRE